MKRRDFVSLLSGAAVWPLIAHAQQTEGVRRIGVLVSLTPDDTEGKARFAAFQQGLQQLGWDRRPQSGVDIVGLEAMPMKFGGTRRNWWCSRLMFWSLPEAQLWGRSNRRPLPYPLCLRPSVIPLGPASSKSLARPGGNITGFAVFEYAIGGKWLALLKEVSPRTNRVAVLRDPAIALGPGQLGAIQTAAPWFGMEVIPINVREPDEIERAITAFAKSSNGGLIVTGSPLAQLHRGLIISLAARHKLPAIYFERFFVADGGLISYGPDFVDQYRRAAGYVDRILKGEKPADMPVQAPTKYELVINLKTAKALGLTVRSRCSPPPTR